MTIRAALHVDRLVWNRNCGVKNPETGRNVWRLNPPEERAEAATAIRGLIERIVLTPGEKWGEIHATLHGDLATIVEWTGNGGRKGSSGTPGSGLPVSAKGGAGILVRIRQGRPAST